MIKNNDIEVFMSQAVKSPFVAIHPERKSYHVSDFGEEITIKTRSLMSCVGLAIIATNPNGQVAVSFFHVNGGGLSSFKEEENEDNIKKAFFESKDSDRELDIVLCHGRGNKSAFNEMLFNELIHEMINDFSNRDILNGVSVRDDDIRQIESVGKESSFTVKVNKDQTILLNGELFISKEKELLENEKSSQYSGEEKKAEEPVSTKPNTKKISNRKHSLEEQREDNKVIFSDDLPPFLEVGIDDDGDMPPLHTAVIERRIDIVKKLLEKNEDIEAKDDSDRTPLHWAASLGLDDIVEILLEAGADIEVEDESDMTPLLLAEAGEHNNIIAMLKKKEQVSTKPNTKKISNDLPPFLEAGIDIEIVDGGDMTPIHVAAFEGHIDIVEILLGGGADIEAKNYDGLTPLYQAALAGHDGIVKILLEAGANIEVTDCDDMTPLHQAASKGMVAVAVAILEGEVNIEAEDEGGMTPLHMAAFDGHIDIVEILLEKNADIEAKDHEDMTPLDCAIKEGHTNIVEMLKKKEQKTPSAKPTVSEKKPKSLIHEDDKDIDFTHLS